MLLYHTVYTQTSLNEKLPGYGVGARLWGHPVFTYDNSLTSICSDYGKLIHIPGLEVQILGNADFTTHRFHVEVVAPGWAVPERVVDHGIDSTVRIGRCDLKHKETWRIISN